MMVNYKAEEIATLNPLHLWIQLKDTTETLQEREEELQLWRLEQSRFEESESLNSLLKDQLVNAKEEIKNLKSAVEQLSSKSSIAEDGVINNIDLQESYTTLFTQYQEAQAKIDDLQLQLEEITAKYQDILPYVKKMVEVEANLMIALKKIDTMKYEREIYS